MNGISDVTGIGIGSKIHHAAFDSHLTVVSEHVVQT